MVVEESTHYIFEQASNNLHGVIEENEQYPIGYPEF
jgi:hypothetical protein